MPEQSPVAPKSGDVFGICRACGNRMALDNTKAYVEDLEQQLAVARLEITKKEAMIDALGDHNASLAQQVADLKVLNERLRDEKASL